MTQLAPIAPPARDAAPRRNHFRPASISAADLDVYPLNSLTLSELRAMVCAEFFLDPREMTLGRRFQGHVRARQVFCLLARTYSNASLPRIGRMAGVCHTTALAEIASIRVRLAETPEDAPLARAVRRLIAGLEARRRRRVEA